MSETAASLFDNAGTDDRSRTITTSAAPAPIEPQSLVSRVMELASSPDVNPEMFDRLVAWQERAEARHAEIAFNVAMNAAQAEIQPVARTAENTQTRSFYAKLEAVDAAIRPIYLRHGFSLSYNTVAPLIAANIRVECRCAHSAGHAERFYREAPADTLGPKGSAVKTVLHGGGSTETFLKRYLACGIFNVVFRNQDDDGVRGGQRFITPDQCVELLDMMKEAGRQESTFLDRAFGGAVHSIEEVEAGAYVVVKNMLSAIIAQQQRKKGAADASV